MSLLDERIARAAKIIEILRSYSENAVANEAAKQLETLLRGVLRAKAMGKSKALLLKRLEWAA